MMLVKCDKRCRHAWPDGGYMACMACVEAHATKDVSRCLLQGPSAMPELDLKIGGKRRDLFLPLDNQEAIY